MRALRAANVTAVALIATCSEGDNTEDAAAMADAVAGVLGLGLDRGGVEIADAGEKIARMTDRAFDGRYPRRGERRTGSSRWRAKSSREGRGKV